MKKLLKYTGIALGIVVALVVVAAIAAPLLLDPNAHKERIAALVKEHTGRDIRIDGDIGVSVLPWLGVKLGAVTLGNAAGFGDQPFARIDAMQVRVKLVPLLSREVQMDTVSVDGLVVNLARRADGTDNWSDLAGAKAEGEGKPADATPLAALAIGGLRLRGASLGWDDAVAGQRVRIERLDLDTGPLRPDAPVDATVAFDLDSATPPLTGRVKGKVRLSIDPAAGRFGASGIGIEADLAGGAIPGGKARVTLAGDAVYDTAVGALALSGFEITTDNPALPGASGTVKVRTDATVRLEPLAVTLAGLDASGRLSGGPVPGSLDFVTRAGTVTLDPGASTVAVTDLALDLPAFDLAGTGGSLALRTGLTGNYATRDFGFAALEASGKASGGGVPGKLDFAVKAASVGLNLTAQTVAATDLKVDLPAFDLAGHTGKLVATGRVVGNYGTRDFAIAGLDARGEVAAAALGPKPLPVALRADLTLDGKRESLTAEGLHLEAAGARLDGRIAVADAFGAPKVSGSLVAPEFDLRALLATLGQPAPQTTDPKVLTRVSFGATLAASRERVTLDPFSIGLDGSTLKGKLDLVDPMGKRAVRLDVRADALDVDRYLPPAAVGAKATPATAGASAAGLPLEDLRALDAKGTVRIGKLAVSGLALGDVAVTLDAGGGLIRAAPLQAQLYGGRYAGGLTLDARGQTPTVTLDERLEAVRMDQLLAALKIDAGGLDFSGGTSTVRLKGQATGDPKGQRFRITGLDLDASLGGKGFPNKRLDLGVAGDADIDLAAQTLAADPLEVRLPGMKARAKLDVAGLLGAPQVKGTLDVAPFDARALLKTLGQPAPVTADPSALTKVSLRGTVNAAPDRLEVSGLDAKIDATTLKGSFSAALLTPPAYRFDLDVDAIDADRYLSPAAPKGAVATPGAAATALPVDLLRTLDAQGRLKVGSLKINNVRISDVRLELVAKDGTVQARPLAARLYDGTYDGNIRIDARGKKPVIAMDEKIAGVQAGALLQDLRGDSPISGLADLRIAATASGLTTDEMMSTLGGDVAFKMRDGTVKGVDLANSVCGALAAINFDKLNKQSLIQGLVGLAAAAAQKQPQAGGDGGTRFTDLTGTARIDNGIARNEDLVLVSPVARVSGAGTVDLPRDRIDYLANAELTQSCAGIGQRELAGHLIPVKVTGQLSDPKVQTSLPAGLIGALTSRRAQQAPAPAPQQVVPLPGSQPAPQQAQPAQQPQKPADVLKEIKKEAIGNILKGIFK